MTNNSTTWENTDGCADQYICPTGLYVLSMLYYAYNIVTDSGVGSPGHIKHFVDSLNVNDKTFITDKYLDVVLQLLVTSC